MSSWNYRVLRSGEVLTIHEVYYDDSMRPIGFSAGPSYPRGGDLDALKEELERYIAALEKPVLDADADFPPETEV